MAMPQRDEKIEAIKRRAVEKKAALPAGQQEPASIPHDSSRRNSAQAGLLR